MLSRVKLVDFKTEFKQHNLEFDEADWAKCLLYIAKNIDNMPEPIEPVAQSFEELNNENEDPNRVPLHMPEAVLYDEIN